MTSPPPAKPETRKLWRLALYAVGLAANLYALSIELKGVLAGGGINGLLILETAICGMFAAFLYIELGKPKAGPPSP